MQRVALEFQDAEQPRVDSVPRNLVLRRGHDAALRYGRASASPALLHGFSAPCSATCAICFLCGAALRPGISEPCVCYAGPQGFGGPHPPAKFGHATASLWRLAAPRAPSAFGDDVCGELCVRRERQLPDVHERRDAGSVCGGLPVPVERVRGVRRAGCGGMCEGARCVCAVAPLRGLRDGFVREVWR